MIEQIIWCITWATCGAGALLVLITLWMIARRDA
jgi:hypothetical protein